MICTPTVDEVFEVIEEDAANAAGISLRFQCQRCGSLLFEPDQRHEDEEGS